MRQTERQLPRLLEKLRWTIPALMAALGVGYTLVEHLLLSPDQVAPVHIIREALVIGSLGPVLAWAVLTWATRIARSRGRALAALERRALQLETASHIGQKITAMLETDALLAEVVELIRDSFGYDHVCLFLAEDQADQVVLRACSGLVAEPLRAKGLRLKIGDEGIIGWVAQAGQPVLCNDVAQDPRYLPHELLPETRAELAIPLKLGQTVAGVLDVQSARRDAFGEDDVTALQVLGGQVAVALENARLFQAVRRQVEVMRVLHSISLDITSQADGDQVLATILEQATALLNARGSSISVYDAEAGLVRRIAVHNLSSRYRGMALQVGEGAAGQVVATGQPVIVNDYEHWPWRSPSFEGSPYNAILSVPLHWEGQVFGALCVLDSSQRRRFTDEDVGTLSLFADLASIGLKSAELYAQVIHLNRDLEYKIERRSRELLGVREELARKAEQLQWVLAATVRIQEEERTRIARDLHDGSNQLITAALYEIQAGQESVLGQRWEVALEKLKTAKQLLRQIEAENRCIIFGLRPPILDTQGLVPALKWQADAHQQQYETPCEFEISGRPVRLAPEVEATIYRILQETLNNVAAHARARHVWVWVKFGAERLRVVVKDDGLGFDYPAAVGDGSGQMGLIGMEERAQSIGGWLEVQSIPNHGTRVTLEVPLPADREKGANGYPKYSRAGRGRPPGCAPGPA